MQSQKFIWHTIKPMYYVYIYIYYIYILYIVYIYIIYIFDMFCFEDTTISRGFPAISHLLPWHRRKAQDFAQQSHGFRPLSSLVTRTEHASQGHRIPVGSVKISKNARWTIQLTEQEDKQGLGGWWVLNGFIISYKFFHNQTRTQFQVWAQYLPLDEMDRKLWLWQVNWTDKQNNGCVQQ